MKDLKSKIISEIASTKCFDTFLVEGAICVTVVKKNAEITLEDAYENTKSVLKVSEGKKYPMLVDTREIRSISKEARDHFSMRNRNGNVNSIAVLIGSPISVVVGNFFMGLNKPAVPTKLFLKPEKAFVWLKKFNS
jgi:hypothetical protein